MKCPFCHAGEFKVIDSRHDDGEFPVRRRRACEHCKVRAWTVEHLEETPLKVIKKTDNRREPFDAVKLRAGLEKACYKRPVTEAQLEEAVFKIEAEVRALYHGEVAAAVVGDLAMEYLRKLDQVAYVRFASVYREFKDVSDFMEELQPMLAKGNGHRPRRPR